MENLKVDNISNPTTSSTQKIDFTFDNSTRISSSDFGQEGHKKFCFMSMSASIEADNKSDIVDMSPSENYNNFNLNNQMWNHEKQFESFNNFDSGYFDEIVKMGKDAVPYILSELKKGPSQIVHALDLIYPGKVKYNGFVPLKTACETWISILSKTGIV